MAHYRLKIRIAYNDRQVVLEDENGKLVGIIKNAEVDKCDKRNTYSFKNNDEDETILALKTLRFWDLNVGKYYVITDGSTEVIKETPGQNLILFRAEGKLDGERFVAKETNDGQLKLLLEKQTICFIEERHGKSGAFIDIHDDIEEGSKLFAVCVLMYFMFKQYLRQSSELDYILDYRVDFN
ncbi:hypothetical protein [Aliicoccus persicus]|uniref:Uncharacterized protein n=1 Tax=Aliicoccus persicus TaxID=930138 RepID=A0A662Z795_9STAP|nr:hypothetical protein [Aliicoccus persicus]SEW12338.1 hypothetical protein SAMN05192557_1740 [Aliicoccus persicus]